MFSAVPQPSLPPLLQSWLVLAGRGQFGLAAAALQVHLEVPPELLVSKAVDDWAEKAGQNVDDEIIGITDLQYPAGEDELQH